jgi:RNA polymerase sigma-70 factor, ECF subfamily
LRGLITRNGAISVALTDIDRNLLKRCLAEEAGAWKDFVDRFLGLFTHVIRHTAHARSVQVTTEDVDDLSAEIFLTLLQNNFAVLRHFRGKSSLATYLAVVARRVVVREMSRRRMAEALGHVSASQSAIEQAHAGTAEHQRIDDREEILRLLQELPAEDAAIVRRFHLEGKSYRDISAELGIPENTIGPTLTRARERMRRREVRHEVG